MWVSYKKRDIIFYIKDGVCPIQDEKLGLIAQVNMTMNRMFPLYLHKTTRKCFLTKLKKEAWLWLWLWWFENSTTKEDGGCPSCVWRVCCYQTTTWSFSIQKSWRAKKALELVHSDICGPITPTSNGGKW